MLRLAAALPDPVELERVDGTAEVRSPTCGSVIHTKVALEDGRVGSLSQRVQACAFGQASAALLAQAAAGRDRDEMEGAIAALTDWLGGSEVEAWPGIKALAPARSRKGRHGAILLPFRALLAAMDDAQMSGTGI